MHLKYFVTVPPYAISNINRILQFIPEKELQIVNKWLYSDVIARAYILELGLL